MASRGSSSTTTGIAPADPEHTFDILTPSDPARFYPKFRVVPATVSVEGQTGAWDAVGQTRRLHLSDGSSVRETTTDVDRPGFFAYELTEFTKVFGPIIDHARAEWRFEAVDGGTLITWTYTFFGKPGRRWIVSLIVSLVWAAYMRKVMPGLVAEVGRLTSS
ncbi:MAG: SRPBCC family protein [Actinomycetota bacterium]|nr:SRPBCC family protein [Actinomycetota bacterium]